MAGSNDPTTIKKYANRRLYNTGTSTYVTLEDLAAMVKKGDDFQVVDAKTGDDITHQVLTQIIFEQENKGQNLLPINFLRQLIRFYGDSVQSFVPKYLELSMGALTRDQGKMREALSSLGAAGPFQNAMEEQMRANVAMMERAFRMFSVFPGQPGAETQEPAAAPEAPRETRSQGELEELRREMAEMRDLIGKMGAAGKG
ncbi:polyhydroxyalkanoate synthesis repressor PhaR [Hansschlegelia zhihuaiae]|uniref:Polyhydroxyalkanoate synthesis repressor PhaR n=1 Tax=Hansschlegelia zhihuaiae TaxID=405005 RepID=A0A4Q0MJL9_9HYPH|nr:polyhydroxyalkanoate synthesis repressor PhaR [Hansschlegelia zhihuaiae]RXF73770.1 polyhydroxyalkanoate synthesis repressor PhaR [Hansschlegelia zhihuaiae]